MRTSSSTPPHPTDVLPSTLKLPITRSNSQILGDSYRRKLKDDRYFADQSHRNQPHLDNADARAENISERSNSVSPKGHPKTVRRLTRGATNHIESRKYVAVSLPQRGTDRTRIRQTPQVSTWEQRCGCSKLVPARHPPMGWGATSIIRDGISSKSARSHRLRPSRIRSPHDNAAPATRSVQTIAHLTTIEGAVRRVNTPKGVLVHAIPLERSLEMDDRMI